MTRVITLSVVATLRVIRNLNCSAILPLQRAGAILVYIENKTFPRTGSYGDNFWAQHKHVNEIPINGDIIIDTRIKPRQIMYANITQFGRLS